MPTTHPPAFKRDRSAERALMRGLLADRRRHSIEAREQRRIAQLALLSEQERRKAELTATKYPRRELLELKAVFDEYDADSSGHLDKAELKKALNRQKREAQRHDGRKKTLEERQAEAGIVKGRERLSQGIYICDFTESLFRALDTNANGKVEFDELVNLMYPLASEQEKAIMLTWVTPVPVEAEADVESLTPDQQREVRAMFSLYDKDRNGTISRDEFHRAMRPRHGSDEIDEQMLDAIFDSADADGSGDIDYEEWLVHMREAYAIPPITGVSLLRSHAKGGR